MWNCPRFEHPTDDQLRLLDISSNNNWPSVLFELSNEQHGNSLNPLPGKKPRPPLRYVKIYKGQVCRQELEHNSDLMLGDSIL